MLCPPSGAEWFLDCEKRPRKYPETTKFHDVIPESRFNPSRSDAACVTAWLCARVGTELDGLCLSSTPQHQHLSAG